MKKILYIILACLVTFSCAKENEKISVVELGVKASKIALGPDAGEVTIDVLSDGAFTAVIPEDSWLAFADGSNVYEGQGDEKVKVLVEWNKGIVRSETVTITRESKTVKVEITQEGVIAGGLDFETHSTTVASEGGDCAVRLFTLLKDNEIEYRVEYEEVSGWISSIVKENNLLHFSVTANESDDERFAYIVAYSGKTETRLLVVQQGATEFVVKSLSELKALATGEKTVIKEPVIVSGIVLNDNSEGNGAENRNISCSLKDVHGAEKTIYIQAEDGSEGIRVDFEAVENNITKRYDNVTLLVKGATLVKETDPLRYVITGVTAHNVVAAEAGDETSLVAKVRHIGDLTDKDIYTYVTLADCEIPVRKGPYVPVDIRYTQVMNKYPMVIRDIEGGTSFLMTNIGAAWERDGEGMPQGSGSISGVIVHEKCDNFEWDNEEAAARTAEGVMMDYITELGTISRYQIRPITKSEIRLAKDFEEGFSELLMEIAYENGKYNNITKNTDESFYVHSTYPLVPYPTQNEPVFYRTQNEKLLAFSEYRDWTHLGPLENGVITNPNGGNGVYDYFGSSAHWSVYSAVATTGLLSQQNGSAWYCTAWDGSVRQHWTARFSTRDLTEANFPLSLTFGAVNGYGEFSVFGAPRYWKAEYSFNGSSWTTFGEYTVPDFPIVYDRKVWQCPGFKYVTMNLPENSSLLGKETVYIRLVPSSFIAATADSYDGGSAVKTGHSALNYFAIRYNK